MAVTDRTEEYFSRVINKNTYFFHNDDFEKVSEGYVAVLKNLLSHLKDTITEQGFYIQGYGRCSEV